MSEGGEVFDEGFGARTLNADGQVVAASADGCGPGVGPISACRCGQRIDAS
ncbi:hypothetical protein HG717_34200 [Rhodococcus erythropolis]|uniref:hypothetical protein n=1 Tax=Rhodococcus erythropolis TaxID=1833 RepID=UPI001C9B4C35|nr:hypothetical protein [Rhodococcus erythropolis]MBY6388922.1 hypothetical protein [Rhodococcus erythropolis]